VGLDAEDEFVPADACLGQRRVEGSLPGDGEPPAAGKAPLKASRVAVDPAAVLRNSPLEAVSTLMGRRWPSVSKSSMPRLLTVTGSSGEV
jgi:hypothetical protein